MMIMVTGKWLMSRSPDLMHWCSQKAILPQSSMSQNFNDVQRVEVGHKQVGFSVGWNTPQNKKKSHAKWYHKSYIDYLKNRERFCKVTWKKLLFILTKWERQTAPFDIISSTSAAVSIHKHTKLCKKRTRYHTNCIFGNADQAALRNMAQKTKKARQK